MSIKKQPINIAGKKAPIDDGAVEKFANQAETETQKRKDPVTRKKATVRTPNKKVVPASDKVKRDSFTMPEDDYELISKLIAKLMKSGMLMNKGEILRAGLKSLYSLPIKDLKAVCEQVEKIKTGRPKE